MLGKFCPDCASSFLSEDWTTTIKIITKTKNTDFFDHEIITARTQNPPQVLPFGNIQTFRPATLDTPYDGVNVSDDFIPCPTEICRV